MIPGALICGLVAMCSYGLANTLSLPIAHRFGPARLLWLRGLAICSVLSILAIPSLSHLRDWHAALAAFGIGVLGYLPPLAFTHGIKMSRVSIVSAIAGTSPLITVALSAIFLHAHLHGSQWLGVALIVAANVVVSVNFRNLRESNVFMLASGVPFGLIAALLWGVVFFLIIYPTRALGPWLSTLLLEVGVTAAAGVHVWLRREPFIARQALTKSVFLNGALIAVGSLGFTVGVRWFNVGLVAALANSIALASIVSATLIHHERLTRAEKLLAGLMIFGVVLVSLA